MLVVYDFRAFQQASNKQMPSELIKYYSFACPEILFLAIFVSCSPCIVIAWPLGLDKF
jgi:hypothetical protein